MKKYLCIRESNIKYGIFIFLSAKFSISIDICIGDGLTSDLKNLGGYLIILKIWGIFQPKVKLGIWDQWTRSRQKKKALRHSRFSLGRTVGIIKWVCCTTCPPTCRIFTFWHYLFVFWVALCLIENVHPILDGISHMLLTWICI